MPKRFTNKGERQIEHIEDSEKAHGVSAETAKRIAYATLTKQGTQDGKERYTAKEKRQAAHIAESEEAAGKPAEEAKSIGYATVNKRS